MSKVIKSAPSQPPTGGPAHVPLQRIRLELARDPDFPDGSSTHGYDLIAPLDTDGHISVAGWKKDRDHCRVRRFWGFEPELIGHIVHKPGGTSGVWAFHYDIRGPVGGGGTPIGQDETGFHFETHIFRPGEYVSLKEQDGVLRTFRVKAVVELD
jgi:hypothetical protein